MKARSLFHLLVTTGRSVGQLLPEQEGRIRELSASLAVERVGRGRYRLTYDLDATACSRELDGARFTFHRRGDLAALNAKRDHGLDDRSANWRAAHQTWADLLGVDHGLLRPSAVAVGPGHDPDRTDRVAPRPGTADVAVVSAALVATLAAWAFDPAPAILSGALLGGALAMVDRNEDRLEPALAGALAGGAAGLLITAWTDTALGGPMVTGLAATLAASRLVPAGPMRPGTAMATCLAAATCGLSVAASSPVWWWAVAAVVTVDVARALLSQSWRNVGEGIGAAALASTIAAAAWAADIGSHGTPARSLDTRWLAGDGAMVAQAVPAAVALAGVALWSLLVGTRNRLGGWAVNPVLAAAAIVTALGGAVTEHRDVIRAALLSLATAGSGAVVGLWVRRRRPTRQRAPGSAAPSGLSGAEHESTAAPVAVALPRRRIVAESSRP